MLTVLYAILWFMLKTLLIGSAVLLMGIGLMWLGFSIVHNWSGGRRG